MSNVAVRSLPFGRTQAICTLAFGIPSLIGSSFILVSAVYLRRKLPLILKCVACMSFCDLLYVSKYVVHALVDLTASETERLHLYASDWCIFLGAWGQLSGLATASWSFCIALDIYLNLHNPFRHKSVRSEEHAMIS